MSKLLSINNLSVSYGVIQALRDVSIEVEEGSIVAILGANGGGKTTLLKKISGLISAVEGSIIFNSEDITNLPAEKMTQKGFFNRDAQYFERSSYKKISINSFKAINKASSLSNESIFFEIFLILEISISF